MSESLLTADQHYGHANIIHLDGRPFSSDVQMNDELVRRQNARVEAAGGDEVDIYMLGDFAYPERSIDVGVDVINFAPASLEEIPQAENRAESEGPELEIPGEEGDHAR